MPVTTIIDNGVSLKITVGTNVRNVLKAQIKEISIIKNDVIKIDVGEGALRNIFLPYTDVTSPSQPDAASLRDTVLSYLEPPGGTGSGATEAKQDTQITSLNAIQNSVQNIQGYVSSLDNKIFFEPLQIDNSGAGVVYKGYALPGSSQDNPVWAIEKIETVSGVEVHTWANGGKGFNSRWVLRETLLYS